MTITVYITTSSQHLYIFLYKKTGIACLSMIVIVMECRRMGEGRCKFISGNRDMPDQQQHYWLMGFAIVGDISQHEQYIS